jgi:hypothetical protein
MRPLWRQTDLPELVATLLSRPGHEAVRTLVANILRHGFGAAYAALDHEVRLPEVRGRADMLFGATVFEFKSDLRREMDDVLARLPDYLAERERQTRRRYLGITTDGVSFVALERRSWALIERSRGWMLTPTTRKPCSLGSKRRFPIVTICRRTPSSSAVSSAEEVRSSATPAQASSSYGTPCGSTWRSP